MSTPEIEQLRSALRASEDARESVTESRWNERVIAQRLRGKLATARHDLAVSEQQRQALASMLAEQLTPSGLTGGVA